uniref:Uncharacterized protein n=1 Tax=Hemiselmis andersenii TaxID=464988 RepID=A0A6U4MIH4_HEMAN|mmetsp:Transcript_22453/g.52107  ORF Transcript_22453/g.52107 Transcript_22453/m.52107 type:complete len:203 (+) Transcript_22453:54-662(+)
MAAQEVLVTNGAQGAPSMMSSGNFDFGGWEEDNTQDSSSKGSSIDGLGMGPPANKTRNSRQDFINASHGREAGSLSPVASLRQCSLTPGQQPGKKRSVSPLRIRGQGRALASTSEAPHAGLKRDSLKSDDDQEEIVDDGFDTWRGLSWEDESKGGIEGLVGAAPLKSDSLEGDLESLMRPTDSMDSMEEGLQALLKQPVPEN